MNTGSKYDPHQAAIENAALEAEAAWQHAEQHHDSDKPDNASLRIDYLRSVASELRAIRITLKERS